MSTSVVYKAKWTGKDPTMVRCHPLGEKVEVKKGETVDVEQSVAQRLMREPNWEVSDEVEVKDMKHGETKEEAQARAGGRELTDEEKAEAAKKERTAEIKKMNKDALDAYIAAHPTIPQDLKNNDEKKAAIVAFEFEGQYQPADTGNGEGAGAAQ